MTAVLLAAACAGGDEPVSAPVEHEARRSALREELRRTLGDRYDEPLPAASPEELAEGRRIWERLCASCHGANGRGATSLARMLPVPPGNLADPDRASFFSPRAKAWIVAEGSPGTPMTAWRSVLSEEAIHAVVAYAEALAKGEPPEE